MADALDQYEEDFKNASAQSAGFVKTNIPDGEYGVEIVDLEYKERQLDGAPFFVWRLKIITGDQYGHVLDKMVWLARDVAKNIFKSDLTICGIDADTISLKDVRSRSTSLVGLRLDVVKKTKGEYTNIYFNGITGADQFFKAEVKKTVEQPEDDIAF